MMESETWLMVAPVLTMFALWQIVLWDQRRENKKWRDLCDRSNKLAERYTVGFNRMRYALERVEEARDLNSAREIARRALEE